MNQSRLGPKVAELRQQKGRIQEQLACRYRQTHPECVSCIYTMHVHPGKAEPGLVACICKTDKQQHQQAQKWLVSWRENQS